jgi:hypothetical protein
MISILLIAGVLLLLPIAAHAKNGPSMTRRIALTKVRQSDWERPFLEQLWVLSYAALALLLLALLGGILLYEAGLTSLAAISWIVCGLLALAIVWVCVLPSYTVVKSMQRARDAREARAKRRGES